MVVKSQIIALLGHLLEIQKNVKIGKNTRIQSHSFIFRSSNVKIGNDCLIGHGVNFYKWINLIRENC